jgi:hypothetical protein
MAAGLNVANAGIKVGLPVILSAGQTFDGRGADYTLSGSVDLNGHVLTLLGSALLLCLGVRPPPLPCRLLRVVFRFV